MSNAKISTAENIATLTNADGIKLTYSSKTDERVIETGDNKIGCRSIKEAYDLAAEIRAWGFEAEANNFAVVLG